MADKFNLKAAYEQYVRRQSSEIQGDAALKHAIGGQFDAFGVIEREMLIHYGLHKQSNLVDVGCGSGRLAIPLSGWLEGRYLGTDLVDDLLAHAREKCARPDWRFEQVSRLAIPAENETADMVCFFSVMTHLLHEQCYLYLEEAKRVLRPGGRIVFSFLEFRMAFHWGIFEATVNEARGEDSHPLNVFVSRDAISAWAEHLELKVVDIRNGDEPFVPLSSSITLEDGRTMEDFGNLGQSICVLEKPQND